MKAADVKRLKELEKENGQLKRLVADKELENLLSPVRKRKAVRMLVGRLASPSVGCACLPARAAPRSATARSDWDDRTAGPPPQALHPLPPLGIYPPAGATAAPTAIR